MDEGNRSLWVFGYGSLCWNPGFEYGDSVVGHIEGFSRRFWQGNSTHRGTTEKPGRVATLTEEKQSRTHGIAFKLVGEAALDYLEKRECKLGGYVTKITTFHPRAAAGPFPVLLYIATPASREWMGPAPLQEVAEQVVECSGAAGHNVEYVLRLADWFRINLPDVMDDHLFTLEAHVRFKIKERNMCMKTLMREECSMHRDPALEGEAGAAAAAAAAVPVPAAAAAADDQADRTNTFAFASNVGRKGLRCLNV